jgi:hypothetical protein
MGFSVVVGEWSLATDNCAMWLNGFNDNLPGYPLVQCEAVPCPEPYMGREQPGAPPDASRGLQGPFGQTPSGPECAALLRPGLGTRAPSALPGPALPRAALPCPALPCPALPCQVPRSNLAECA